MLDLVEGWTGPIEYILKADNAAVNLTGCTVVTTIKTKLDVAKTISGTTTVVDATAGKVRFSPSATDLLEADSPLAVRFKVTDAASKAVYFPNGVAEKWVVRN